MHKEFRIGWLLLLLQNGSGYGYQLRGELRRRALEIDRAVMYRSLREMEDRGMISSRWMHSDEGPPRRVYDIKDAGRAELARIAAAMLSERDARNVFLTEYEQCEQSGLAWPG